MANSKQHQDISSLQFAAAVQQAILDDQAQHLHSANIAVTNQMCQDIGGDFYYFNQLNDQQVAFAIGDVVGHGTSAALVMSLIMGTLRADQQNNSRPAAIVHNVNNMLIRLGEQIDEHITCSMIYGVVDLPSRVLFYVNAGHPEPIVANYTNHNIHKLQPTTLLLGIQAGVRPESCHQFHQGDSLILFTDGLTEAQNQNEQMLGREQLRKYILQSIDQNPKKSINQIMKRIKDFYHPAQQQDDQTLLVINFQI